MRTTRLTAGAAIVGGPVLIPSGLGGLVVAADASPSVTPRQDPASPTYVIEPAPASPSTDISTDTGIPSSTDFGSSMPSPSVPESTVGSPPPAQAPTGPSTPQGHDAPPAAPPNTGPGDPMGPPEDAGHPCRPMWCPRPPEPPGQPLWPLSDPFWPYTSDTTESITVVPPSPCITPPLPDASPPEPFEYGGQTGVPAFDGDLRQWGFWYSGNWVPMFGSKCQSRPREPARPNI